MGAVQRAHDTSPLCVWLLIMLADYACCVRLLCTLAVYGFCVRVLCTGSVYGFCVRKKRTNVSSSGHSLTLNKYPKVKRNCRGAKFASSRQFENQTHANYCPLLCTGFVNAFCVRFLIMPAVYACCVRLLCTPAVFDCCTRSRSQQLKRRIGNWPIHCRQPMWPLSHNHPHTYCMSR